MFSGKTVHVYYFMWHLRDIWTADALRVVGDELLIVYEFKARDGERIGYYFRVQHGDGGAATVTRVKVGDRLGELNAPAPAGQTRYYLCDGVPPADLDMPTLEESSPFRELYKAFQK